MQQGAEKKNPNRFTGFADTYDRARPSVPDYAVETIVNYLERPPQTVVDLGCGTGLSTLVWNGRCQQVIGIEPSPDMLSVAAEKACETVRFQQGLGNRTGLKDHSADVVVCSQSFHWMEPASTLAEIHRILTPGGVFATVDCDWPPVTGWRAEQAYMALYQKIKHLEKTLPDVQDSFVRYSKDRHLANIQASGYFRYARELVFSNREPFSRQRFVNLLLSQGSLQTVLKLHPDSIQPHIAAFRQAVDELLPPGDFAVDFSYRMRIGIK